MNVLEGSKLDDFVSPNLPSKCLWSKKVAQDEALRSKLDPHIYHKFDASKAARAPEVLPNILSMIGNTPLVKLNRIPQDHGLRCQIFAKCEFFNAGGSVKDRIGLRMIEEAERAGKLIPGKSTIIEPTSGNTGIGLALAGAVKGYRVVIVMPEKMSFEKVNLLRLLGAQVIRTPTSAKFDAPNSLISIAQKLCKQIPHAVILDQYRNPGNPLAHYDHTAEEILAAMGNEKIDAVVLGAGTGGTADGVGRKFKEKMPECKVIGVDPKGSSLAEPEDLNREDAGRFYEVEGIGYDFLPTVLDREVIDKWYKTEDKESILMARELVSKEGFLCGMSSGSALVGAIKAAKELGFTENHRVVVILPDTVRNYMSKYVCDTWMIERGFITPEAAQKDLYCLSLNGGSKPWFWDLDVSNLVQGLEVISAHPKDACKDVVQKMKLGGYDQMPVTEPEDNALIGMVTVQHIMAKVAGGSIRMDDPIEDIIIKAFPRIQIDEKIGFLAHLLRNSQYVAVVDRLDKKHDAIKAILTHIDILNFLDRPNGNHVDMTDQ